MTDTPLKREIITRRQAIEWGFARFYTGRRCANGHLDERYTASKNCVKCHAANARRGNARYRVTFPERIAYAEQRTKARKRGIAWSFTFDSWWNLWAPWWPYRGRAGDDLCMARYGDVCPYSPSNVYITTNTANHKERGRVRRARQAT